MDEGLSYQFAPVNQKRHSRHELKFDLTLRQQPKQSRMCGIGEKADRRPIDPPPIIQLRVSDASMKHDKTTFLYNPYYFMYASLMLADSDEEMHLLHDGKTRSTTGSLVSSLYHLKDVNNSDGGFFVFPDLSVRMEGRYRLKFTLFEIVGMEVFFCRSICSDVFTVYSAKRFPGMEESTFLSRSFADQGLKIRIRKEVRIRRRGSKWKENAGSPSDRDTQKFQSRSPSSAKANEPDNKESEGSGWSEEENMDVDERRKRYSEDKGYNPVNKRRPTESAMYQPIEFSSLPTPAFARSSQPPFTHTNQPYSEPQGPIKSSSSSQGGFVSPMATKPLQYQHPTGFSFNALQTRPTSNIRSILNSEQLPREAHPDAARGKALHELTSHPLSALPFTTSRSDSKSVLSIQNIISPESGPYPAPIPIPPLIADSYLERKEHDSYQGAAFEHNASDRSLERAHPMYSPGVGSIGPTGSQRPRWPETPIPTSHSMYQDAALPDHPGYSHPPNAGLSSNPIGRLPNISSLINPTIQPSEASVPQYEHSNTTQLGNRSNRYNQFQ